MRPLIFLVILLFVNGVLPGDPDPPKTTTVYKAPQDTSCIIVSQPSRYSYTFLNNCGDRVYINACITDSWSDTKQYKSGQKIQVAGRYTIYPDASKYPYRMAFNISYTDPNVPVACAK